MGPARIDNGVTHDSTTIYGFHRVLHALGVSYSDMTDTPSSFDDTDTPQSPDWEAVARHLTGEDTPESVARVSELTSDPSAQAMLIALDSAAS